ncbi:MAG: HU family DNA-binding protein [Bacteroidales bacterium]
MALKYYKKKRRIKLAGLDEERYCITLKKQGTKTTEDITNRLADAMSIEKAEAKIMFKEFGKQLAASVLSGQSVNMEGLGTFTPSIAVKSVPILKEVDASCIKRAKVNFRLSPKLAKRFANVQVLPEKNIDRKHV